MSFELVDSVVGSARCPVCSLFLSVCQCSLFFPLSSIDTLVFHGDLRGHRADQMDGSCADAGPDQPGAI